MSIIELIRSNKNYFEDFITRSTYNSNAIEGNTLSYADTYALVFNDNSFIVKAEPREIYEAINHKYALNYMLSKVGSDISERIIKNIGIRINKNIHEINGYRKIQVYLKGAKHIPPEPNKLNQAMMYFVYNYNNMSYNSIFDKVAETHIQFEKIHPFEDGNGRTGRLIINFELLRHNMPPVIIPKEDRQGYFNILARENMSELSEYFENLSREEYIRLRNFGYKG